MKIHSIKTTWAANQEPVRESQTISNWEIAFESLISWTIDFQKDEI